MPYSRLPDPAFWRLCRDDPEFRVQDIYAPKFSLAPGTRIATAGSCFAQNVVRYLRRTDLEFVDVEPAPSLMRPELAARFGYGLFSARYGNIYTARQLRQLLQDVLADAVHDCAIWKTGAGYYDGLRPNTEQEGLPGPEAVRDMRRDHLRRVHQMFAQSDVFFFTLGLTETWADRATGVVFPTAPGVVAGQFDPDCHVFRNLDIADCMEDMAEAIDLMRTINPDLKVILTVSPVPLTATATGEHVLSATTYSKSVLRVVAGEIARADPGVDYFPSYEIVTGTPFRARAYSDNLRTVTPEGVETVMSVFFAAHGRAAKAAPAPLIDPPRATSEDDAEVCEEAMLEAFARP